MSLNHTAVYPLSISTGLIIVISEHERVSKWVNTGVIILVGKYMYLTHTYIGITSSHINDIKHYPDNKNFINGQWELY